VLLSVMPTFAQLRGGAASAATESQASAHRHCERAMRGTDAAEHRDGAPCPHHPGDDAWHKCGYCDFLTHAPAIGGVEFVARFATALPEIVARSADARPARATASLAARPRGPPHFV
jgi:hypothetical protein